MSAWIALMFTSTPFMKKAGESPLSEHLRPCGRNESCAVQISTAERLTASGGLRRALAIEPVIAPLGAQLGGQRERLARLLVAAELHQRAARGRTARSRSSGRARRPPRTPRGRASNWSERKYARPSASRIEVFSGSRSRALAQRHRGGVEVPRLEQRRAALEEVVDVVHLPTQCRPGGQRGFGGSAHHARRRPASAAAAGQLGAHRAPPGRRRRRRRGRRSAARAARARSPRRPGVRANARLDRAQRGGRARARGGRARSARSSSASGPQPAATRRRWRRSSQQRERRPRTSSGAAAEPISVHGGPAAGRPRRRRLGSRADVAAEVRRARRAPAAAPAVVLVGLRARGRGGRRRVQRHPADSPAYQTSTHECASRSRTTYSPALRSQRAGREAGRDARGHAAHAQQQRHRARVLLAVAGLGVEQEAVEVLGRRRRRLGVGEVVAARGSAAPPATKSSCVVGARA